MNQLFHHNPGDKKRDGRRVAEEDREQVARQTTDIKIHTLRSAAVHWLWRIKSKEQYAHTLSTYESLSHTIGTTSRQYV